MTNYECDVRANSAVIVLYVFHICL